MIEFKVGKKKCFMLKNGMILYNIFSVIQIHLFGITKNKLKCYGFDSTNIEYKKKTSSN